MWPRRRWLMVVVACACAATACEGTAGNVDTVDGQVATTPSPGGPSDLPTNPLAVGPDVPMNAALLIGRLRGDAEQRCVWVEPIGEWASLGERVAVVWPKGFSVRFSPLELLDEDGRRVAVEGDVLELGGGDTNTISRCRVSDTIFSAGEVVPSDEP